MLLKLMRSALILFGAFAITTTACAPQRESATRRLETDTLRWTPFQWVTATIGGREFSRAAILVPLTADTLGGTYWLQLDTGADTGVWLYTAPLDQLLRRRGPARDTTRAFALSTGRIGGYPLRQQPVNIQRFAGDTVRMGDPTPKIGTLGLNFFRDKIVLLDFPSHRFAIADSAAALPTWIEQRARWVKVDYRNDKMFVPLSLAGTTYDDFFYDSGASLFPISTTKEIWEKVTGRTGSEPDNVVWTVRSFGQDVTLIGAPVQGQAAVGEAALKQPLAFYMAKGPERLDLRKWGFRTSGLVGNVLFADRYLIVVDLPRRRLGLVERVAL